MGLDYDYIKPSKEDRIDWTYTKVQRAAFIEKMKEIGIPVLKYIAKDYEINKDIDEYSFEYLMDFLVNTVIDLQERIEKLEKIDEK